METCFRKGSYGTATLKETTQQILIQPELDSMTEKPNEQTQPSQPVATPSPEKLLIDDNSNFPFHAAYLVYSDIFDHATSDNVKQEMNQNIQALKNGEIDTETFYRNIAHHRKLDTPRQERFSLQTQRKKDWRIKEQRSERIRRHKK